MPVCLHYKDQICAISVWGKSFYMELEQCFRSQTYYTGSILTREGISFGNSKNLTITSKNRTLLRTGIRRSIDKTIIHKEKLVYDFKDLLSGVGGTLSLFIGISVFSICNQIIDAMIYGFRMLRKKVACFRTSTKMSSAIMEFGSSANLKKSPRPSKIPRPLASMTMTVRLSKTKEKSVQLKY